MLLKRMLQCNYHLYGLMVIKGCHIQCILWGDCGVRWETKHFLIMNSMNDFAMTKYMYTLCIIFKWMLYHQQKDYKITHYRVIHMKALLDLRASSCGWCCLPYARLTIANLLLNIHEQYRWFVPTSKHWSEYSISPSPMKISYNNMSSAIIDEVIL